MKNIVFIIIILFTTSCLGKINTSFPKHITNLKVEKVKLYKGFIIVNDSIPISGAYVRYQPFNDESDLYGDLLVGDRVLNSGHSDRYIDVVKKKTNDTIRYYIYTELLEKND